MAGRDNGSAPVRVEGEILEAAPAAAGRVAGAEAAAAEPAAEGTPGTKAEPALGTVSEAAVDAGAEPVADTIAAPVGGAVGEAPLASVSGSTGIATPLEHEQLAARAAGRTPVVVFDGVRKTYAAGTRKEFTAITDVNFVVEDIPDKGEFICVLGPSGCGKSTVLRLIAGLGPQHPPSSGRVEVFGKAIMGPGSDRGMVFQSYTSFDNRTVLRNITFGLECRGVGRAERDELALELIAKVGLSREHDAQKYPHQLSGGMQQRVAIARTLILRPRIILMDEPFGALDPITRLQMQDLLVSLWREVQATVFFVTHSIEEAVYLGDRIYIFSNSPGTLLREVAVPPPDRPAMEMQRDPAFQETVFELRETIQQLEARS